MLSLLNSLKNLIVSMSAILNLAKYCVFGHIEILRQFLHRKTILFFVTFSKSNAFYTFGVAPKIRALYEVLFLRESKGALIDTLHMSSCALKPQTPTHFVRSQKKGTDYSVLLFSFFHFDASPRQRLRKSAYSPTLDLGSRLYRLDFMYVFKSIV